MIPGLEFHPHPLPPETAAVRAKVRGFLAKQIESGGFTPVSNAWAIPDAKFSRACGEAGFIAMTWPKAYGGHERTAFERYVVVEELLAAGAPCAYHWVADRQSGPQILRNGSERTKREILPQIAAGRCCFGIGMSEPDTGSDLASVRTKAEKVDGGWRITGRKVWTSNAHVADYLIVLARSAPLTERRHEGLTQFIVKVKDAAVGVRPIHNLAGAHEFNEVTLDEVFVADDFVVGEVGRGWGMVTSELAFERSGPDRFLSTLPLLALSLDEPAVRGDARAEEAIGRLIARVASLRRMSISIAGMLEAGENPNQQAAMVKDLGTNFEQSIPEIVRLIAALSPRPDGSACARDLAHAMLHAPSFSLRGGTREILRGIIARGMGLR